MIYGQFQEVCELYDIKYIMCKTNYILSKKKKTVKIRLNKICMKMKKLKIKNESLVPFCRVDPI